MTKKPIRKSSSDDVGYATVLGDLSRIIEEARLSIARSVNAGMTAAYWIIGRRIVEHEQGGRRRAGYGMELLKMLSADLTRKYGRGFSPVNLSQMKKFYTLWPAGKILQTLSEELKTSVLPGEIQAIIQTPSEKSPSLTGETILGSALACFPLPWSAYVCLLSVKSPAGREFYEAEALRGGWSVRQLKRQIDAQFYERTALSRNKAGMLRRGQKPRPDDELSPEEAIKDPYVLEFLDLTDEYSESDLEEALIRQLEVFLLELGGDFCFVGRQRRLRIGHTWYRVDLVFFHRCLRCLVVIDLKLGEFTHADAGQMHLYLNYAREHWTRKGENPPVGLILCAQKDDAVARYALEGLPNKVMATEYRTALPGEKTLAAEIEKIRSALRNRGVLALPPAQKRRAKKAAKKKRFAGSKKKRRR